MSNKKDAARNNRLRTQNGELIEENMELKRQNSELQTRFNMLASLKMTTYFDEMEKEFYSYNELSTGSKN
jgi:regulator of replication initiation timing